MQRSCVVVINLPRRKHKFEDFPSSLIFELRFIPWRDFFAGTHGLPQCEVRNSATIRFCVPKMRCRLVLPLENSAKQNYGKMAQTKPELNPNSEEQINE